MDAFEDGYPNFEVNENDLLNFEEFCDLRYKDPRVQKVGFFKVYLHKDVKRKTTLNDFLESFRLKAYHAVKETVILKNPVGCGLYGHHNLATPNIFRDQFMETATPDAFEIHEEKPNCCMESLINGGVDALLKHFFSELDAKALPLLDTAQKHRNMSSIASKIPVWRAAFDKRQLYQKQSTVQEKSKVLELSMLSEKFQESSQKKCKCESCAYFDLEIPAHPDAPIGTLYSSGIDESYDQHVRLTENFSMIHLCYKNMLSMLDSAFNGVSFPAMYLGTTHSVFPIHVEDLSLWSFNFLLFGFPKFWIVIPPHSVAKLTDALARSGFGGSHKSCRNSLGHKFFIPSVTWLLSEEIPFNVVLQKEGQGVVLLPNAAHSGGNLGHNVAEACNFGSEAWIPYGCVYPACACFGDAVHVDLTPIVSVHKRALLKAYINNNIMNAAEDAYFLRSVVLPKIASYEECHNATATPSPHIKKGTSRFECPVCPYSWRSNIAKKNVEAHLGKYHSQRLKEDCVVKFLNEKFPFKGKDKSESKM